MPESYPRTSSLMSREFVIPLTPVVHFGTATVDLNIVRRIEDADEVNKVRKFNNSDERN